MPLGLSAAALLFQPLNTNRYMALSDGCASPEPPTEPPQKAWAKILVREYLLEHLPSYVELASLKGQGWDTAAADKYFENQRSRADNADQKIKAGFFTLMRGIGLELDLATSGLTIPSDLSQSRFHRPAILDLCMAPGGFTLAALTRNPGAMVRGISLPTSEGGHDMLLKKKWSSTKPNAQIYVSFRDITLLADEMGVPTSTIPADHPDAASFSPDRPFRKQQFDIVFCDGQVLRTQERHEYRARSEATRLLTSQLVLALTRVRPGGTIIVLMHKADSWPSVLLMYTFSQFSARGIALFKPTKAHKLRSSFYLVARGVQPRHEAAREAVKGWKAKWRMATFGLSSSEEGEGVGGSGMIEGEEEVLGSAAEEKVKRVLEVFGPELVRLAGPVFEIQAEALREAPWMKEVGGKGSDGGEVVPTVGREGDMGVAGDGGVDV